jgi:hypothetical protein
MLDFESKLVHFEHTLNKFDKLIILHSKPLSKSWLLDKITSSFLSLASSSTLYQTALCMICGISYHSFRSVLQKYLFLFYKYHKLFELVMKKRIFKKIGTITKLENF